MRDFRTLNMSDGQPIESDEVMRRRGELEYRNLTSFAQAALFDEGKALITDGLRVEAYSGMTVKVPTGTLIQREIGVTNTIVGVCVQGEDQLIAMTPADGGARVDIVEAQVISMVDKTDYARIGKVATGGIGEGSLSITNQVVNRDVKYKLDVRKQTNTTTVTAATAAVLTGTVAIPGTIDLSAKYLIRLEDGEDGDWKEIDCRGAIPTATSRAEIISAINTAIGRTIAADGAGNVIELTGFGTGETSYFSLKSPIADSPTILENRLDALNVIFGLSIEGNYRYEYRGTNSWIKLAEIDIGAATTTITNALINNIDEKHLWASEASNVVLKNPFFNDPLILQSDSISKSSPKSGGVNFDPGIKVNWTTAQQVGSDLVISGPIVAPALAALNSTDVAFVDRENAKLQVYRFNGNVFAQIGSDLTIPGIFPSANDLTLAALNSTDVAYIDNVNADLRIYRWNGTIFGQIGSDLNIPGISSTALSALNSTDVAFVDETSEDLRLYRWNGTIFAQVGSDFNIGGTVSIPTLAALNSTDVAYVDGATPVLTVYRFDYITESWSQFGSGLAISGASNPSLVALNNTDVACIGRINGDLRIYRFNYTDLTWKKIGGDLNVSGVSVRTAMTTLSETNIAFIDQGNEDLRVYRFDYFISGYPHNPTNPNWS
jgi:hypothetical protein